MKPHSQSGRIQSDLQLCGHPTCSAVTWHPFCPQHVDRAEIKAQHDEKRREWFDRQREQRARPQGR